MYEIFDFIKNKDVLIESIHKKDETIKDIYNTSYEYKLIEENIKCQFNKNLINNQLDYYGKFNIEKILNNIDKNIKTAEEHKNNNAEVSSPFNLLNIICNKNKDIFNKKNKILDYSCGKGNIIISLFINYFKQLINTTDKKTACKIIIEDLLYFGDINTLNVFTTICCLFELCYYFTGEKLKLNYNYSIGDSFDLNLKDSFNISSVDCVFVNPPFQDNKKNKTQHKLWIKFTQKTFDEWLIDDGILIQISPSSFGSPSNKVLSYFHKYDVKYLYLNQEKYFPSVNSSFSWYTIIKNENLNITNLNGYHMMIDNKIIYMPPDLNDISINIHKKVMFDTNDKLDVKYDYVTCHNILLKEENSTLSKTKTETHIYPLFHTNAQIWYSSIKQNFSDKKKVMWTRSGYTKPFYDDGNYGVTDLSYYTLVNNDTEGLNLENNLKLKLFKYILKSAKWSGFGTDKVFYALPKLPDKKMKDTDLYSLFDLTELEIDYINNYKV